MRSSIANRIADAAEVLNLSLCEAVALGWLYQTIATKDRFKDMPLALGYMASHLQYAPIISRPLSESPKNHESIITYLHPYTHPVRYLLAPKHLLSYPTLVPDSISYAKKKKLYFHPTS